MNNRLLANLAGLLILPLVLPIACGSKAPPQLVPPKNPPAVTDLTVYQKGPFLYLEWGFPVRLTDRKTSLDTGDIRYVHIFYSTEEINERNYRRQSQADYRIKPEQLSRRKNRFTVKFPFKPHQLEEKSYFFTLYYRYRHKKSPLSRPVSIRTLLPARAVTDLRLTQERKVILLSWSRPTLNIGGDPLSGMTGYRVYRRIGGTEKDPGGFQLLNTGEKLLAEFYQDRETSREGLYRYYVVTTHGPAIESLPSNPVSIQVRNIFPPASPQNLVCVSARDGLQIFWEAVKDQDLDFYRIYRRAEKDFEYQVRVPRITDTYFKDTEVTAGTIYFYQVTAFDTAGNESDPSNTAKEKARQY